MIVADNSDVGGVDQDGTATTSPTTTVSSA